jgi:hypothetical protein
MGSKAPEALLLYAPARFVSLLARFAVHVFGKEVRFGAIRAGKRVFIGRHIRAGARDVKRGRKARVNEPYGFQILLAGQSVKRDQAKMAEEVIGGAVG